MLIRQQNLFNDVRIPLEIGQAGVTATSSLSIKYVLCNKDGVPTAAPVAIGLTNGTNITGSWVVGDFGPLFPGSTSYLLRPPSVAFTSPVTLFSVIGPDGIERIGESRNPDYASLASGSLTAEYVNGVGGVWNVQRGTRLSGSFGNYFDIPISGVTLIVNTSSIAAGVWAAASRTLTTIDTGSIAVQVWLNSGRTLTGIDSASIAAQVWANVTRSLTIIDTGSIAAGVWLNGSRTLTSSSVDALGTATAVWGAVTRSITSGTVDPGTIATAVWNAPNRIATASVSGNVIVDSSAIATAVWAATSRTLTNIDTGSIATQVWAAASRTLTGIDSGSIATQVWSNGSRFLTTSSVDANAVQSAVWNAATRSLTLVPSASVDVTAVRNALWNAPRASFVAAGTFGEGVASVQGNVNGNVTGSVASVLSLASSSITSASFTTSATDRLANSMLDLTNAIETNITVRNALRVIAAALAGVTNGAGTANITFSNIGLNNATRIAATVNPVTGERQTVTLTIP